MSKKASKRPKQNEFDISGVGVEVTTDKKLIDLAESRVDENDAKKDASKRLKEIDSDIINRMHVLGLKNFRVGQKFFRIDPKELVKVSKIKDKQIAALDDKDAAGA